MVILRFPDLEAKKKALGFLTGRFSFKSWATGELMVSESALEGLALEGVAFTVEGQATYGQRVPSVRVPTAVAV